jgi:hypothetical protein
MDSSLCAVMTFCGCAGAVPGLWFNLHEVLIKWLRWFEVYESQGWGV